MDQDHRSTKGESIVSLQRPPLTELSVQSVMFCFRSKSSFSGQCIDIPGHIVAACAPLWHAEIDADNGTMHSIGAPMHKTKVFYLNKRLVGVVLLKEPEDVLRVWQLVRNWMMWDKIPTYLLSVDHIYILAEAWFLAAHLKMPVLQNDLMQTMHELFSEIERWSVENFEKFCDTLELHAKAMHGCGRLIGLGQQAIATVSQYAVPRPHALRGVKPTKTKVLTILGIGQAFLKAFTKAHYRSKKHFFVDESLEEAEYDFEDRVDEYEEIVD